MSLIVNFNRKSWGVNLFRQTFKASYLICLSCHLSYPGHFPICSEQSCVIFLPVSVCSTIRLLFLAKRWFSEDLLARNQSRNFREAWYCMQGHLAHESRPVTKSSLVAAIWYQEYGNPWFWNEMVDSLSVIRCCHRWMVFAVPDCRFGIRVDIELCTKMAYCATTSLWSKFAIYLTWIQLEIVPGITRAQPQHDGRFCSSENGTALSMFSLGPKSPPTLVRSEREVKVLPTSKCMTDSGW